MSTATAKFTAVTSVGDLLPADFLLRVAEDGSLPGSAPADYKVIGAKRTVADDAERHWNYLKGVWRELRRELTDTDAPSDPTGRVRGDWLEPLFGELGFGLLQRVPDGGIVADDETTTFPVSHRWGHVPIHFTRWEAGLEKRTADGRAPHSLVQECLNRTSDHLWAIVTNGRQLRLLRDSSALAGAAYIEFDLVSIFDGELVSEFVLLYRLLHVSRFAVPEDASPAACVLERWRGESIETGKRVLDQMKAQVAEAITILGSGFLGNPRNARVLDPHRLDAAAFHQALLRLTYRLLFWFVAEERGVLHPDGTDEVKLGRYLDFFAAARLRGHAMRRRGSAHSDRYRALRLVLDALGEEKGLPELALPGLGGVFDRTDADSVLDGLELSNEALLNAVRVLSRAYDRDSRRYRMVDYRHLGAEELGSVYESLLELVPKLHMSERRFALVSLAGNQRKTSGSYYTPKALIEELLDSTLNPVIDAAVTRGVEDGSAGAVERELLSLTVCDPACGSGHFLVAASRRLAKRLAAVREGNAEPTPSARREALRDVIGRCVYGVDLNPMAVELAKVSLWLEAMVPGKPLKFLDSHVKHGNSLVGAFPALIAQGIPDDAWTPVEGDDKTFARTLKRYNKKERESDQTMLVGLTGLFNASNTVLGKSLRAITDAPDASLSQVHAQESRYRAWRKSPEYLAGKLVADTWCAAFYWPKRTDAAPAPTEGVFRELRDNDAVEEATARQARELADRHAFFHWHLEFPEVFEVPADGDGDDAEEPAGWRGGFSAVVGNPPWERIKLQEQEYFATRDAAIAGAANAAARKRMIAALPETNPGLFGNFQQAKREAAGDGQFLKSSGRFPLTGAGDINTYSVFTETDKELTSPRGRTGVVVPTGIATDMTTSRFFGDLTRNGRLVSFLDFENEAFILSREVHHSVRFCLLTMAGRGERVEEARFAFSTRYIEDLPDRIFAMPLDEIQRVNPNTGTLPVFKSRRDAEITLRIYRNAPILLREDAPDGNPWGLSFMSMFHMANDSHLFRTADQLAEAGWTLRGNVFEQDRKRYLPLLEAKMLHHFDHRFGTYEGQTQAQANMGTLPRLTSEQHDDPAFVTMPRYWVPEFDVPREKKDRSGKSVYEAGVAGKLAARGWDRGWLFGWRDVCRSVDARTSIPTFVPASGVGDKFLLETYSDPSLPIVALGSSRMSFVHDYTTRQKLSGTALKYFLWKQLPALTPAVLRKHERFINRRSLELVYTSHDMTPFAQDLGDDGPPFRWDEERRAVLRAELDALFFHLYGIERDDVDYIMETFPVVKRKDVAEHGTYRTKDLILGVYDRMAAAGVSIDVPPVDGEGFVSDLTPPPGAGPRHPAGGEGAAEGP